MTYIPDLLSSIDSILDVRDQIGGAIAPSYLGKRTWDGDETGLGSVVEEKVQILPSPRVVEFASDSRIFEGGVVKAGDIILKGISKNKYPTENLIDCIAETRNVEKFYVVGEIEYQLVHVRERHLTWDVHLRRRTRQGA